MKEKITQETTKSLSRKQITFDLSDETLRKFYPRPKLTLNPNYHKKAWKDMGRFLKKNGFEHRQYSVYVSRSEMTGAQVSALTKRMVIHMPWLYKCLKDIDVTDIREQHSLMPIVKGMGIVFEKERNDNPISKSETKSQIQEGKSQ